MRRKNAQAGPASGGSPRVRITSRVRVTDPDAFEALTGVRLPVSGMLSGRQIAALIGSGTPRLPGVSDLRIMARADDSTLLVAAEARVDDEAALVGAAESASGAPVPGGRMRAEYALHELLLGSNPNPPAADMGLDIEEYDPDRSGQDDHYQRGG